MAFTVPELPYAYDALEPHIDARTMEIHHTKHHQGYVNNLNSALEGEDELVEMDIVALLQSLDKVPVGKKDAVRNNGGGHANHSLFWKILSPDGGGEPSGALAVEIQEDFASFADFKEEFKEAAMGHFGSGWAWLTVSEDDLEIISTPNQDSPYMHGYVPILGLDVWEHAYYLHYQNRRADYVDAFWNIVNWQEVQRRYEQAIS